MHLETSILSFKHYLLKIEQLLKIWKIILVNVDILYLSSKKLKIIKIYNNDSSILLNSIISQTKVLKHIYLNSQFTNENNIYVEKSKQSRIKRK